MDNSPHNFCINHKPSDLKKLLSFKHRTFNDTDLLYFIEFFKHHYSRNKSLETAFFNNNTLNRPNVVEEALIYFYHYFFSLQDVPARTKKHIASPEKNSGCKRLNMFLRWMVRNDNKGVDFGLWKKISPAQLICPVDVHVARVARHFKLLQHNAANWQAALQLTSVLRMLDESDPVKYDFALFGLGVMERF
jgi:uncharacterized protein (TIGR02757 family)